ncbi:DUF4145 domain-containing protein [Brevibacillus brevis]|uniref:DUF4145 domain-containing protein n=1 Tax=Brevibacillus brevis TaxID=1393 RepID=UPI00165E1618|nr:DUF4145 domain-containing protein [Brevibacillus brevis]
MDKHYPPVFQATSFHCPYCHVYAKQNWQRIFTTGYGAGYHEATQYNLSHCTHCHDKSLWFNGKLTIPDAVNTPPAHDDMPNAILDDYNEAASILNKSPRGAAALLRLCLQKLMKELGEQGKDINADIKSLVAKGLPEQVQKALDILRVVGNESVHPGNLDIRDDHETAFKLFSLINFIVQERITRNKEIDELYSILPEDKRKGIEQRDKIQS